MRPSPDTNDQPTTAETTATGVGAEPRRRVAAGAIADTLAVLLFVLIGRDTHHDSGVLAGLLGTAWPFLLAATLGWAVTRAWRAPARVWPTGVIVWAVTVLGGLALRGVTGGGLSGGFPLVTAIALAVLLLGWRAIVALATRPRR
ncbi:DUF3054 domain-containing protein [Serinibacter salmoneus]|uniref:DUF3054 domain-containing protein n=1 Tax=Serinibacter salmoneus TaxID=556530 RepID=UPI001FE37182|nr:DUF3054 domain-containing protein [Serinibacter salmoneus]